jgi:peptidoglycan/xylan/chitin deacetylase (PgdA/CDA1 family)
MKVLRRILKRAAYTTLAKTGYLDRSAGSGLAVVTYHGVAPAAYKTTDTGLDFNLVKAESLRLQLRLLKDRYNVISPREFLCWCESDHKLPMRSVLLTCDDGLRNTLTEMLPILQEFGLSSLFFVTSASLEDRPAALWHDELQLMFLAAPQNVVLELEEIGLSQRATGKQEKRALFRTLVRRLSQYDLKSRRAVVRQIREQLALREDWDAEYLRNPVLGCRFFPLSVSELRQLAAAGMSIGAHTLSHPVLSVAPPDLAWNEISENRRGLEQALGQPVWALAYPFGDPNSVTSRELEMAERAGFKCAFRNGGGGFGAELPRFGLPRVSVSAEMSLGEFEANVSGFYGSMRKLYPRS